MAVPFLLRVINGNLKSKLQHLKNEHVILVISIVSRMKKRAPHFPAVTPQLISLHSEAPSLPIMGVLCICSKRMTRLSVMQVMVMSSAWVDYLSCFTPHLEGFICSQQLLGVSRIWPLVGSLEPGVSRIAVSWPCIILGHRLIRWGSSRTRSFPQSPVEMVYLEKGQSAKNNWHLPKDSNMFDRYCNPRLQNPLIIDWWRCSSSYWLEEGILWRPSEDCDMLFVCLYSDAEGNSNMHNCKQYNIDNKN